MEILNYISNKVRPIGDLDFLSRLGREAIDNYSDEQLSIDHFNGSFYPKEREKVAKFMARCNESLNTVGATVKRLEDDFKAAMDKVKRSDPGNAPSPPYNRSDEEAVDRYNRRVDEYNNQLEAYRRTQDQARRVQERYQDAVLKFNEKEADLKEQIIGRKEALKPAFDQDLHLFLTKLSQLAIDAFEHDDKIFEGLIFSYLSKKAILELAPRFHDATKEREMNELGKKLDLQIAALLKKDERPIKDGLENFFDYLNQPYQANLKVAQAIETDLANLPVKDYNFHEPTVDKTLALPIETTFDYKKVLDPDELERMAQDVRAKKSDFEQQAAKITALMQTLHPLYEAIDKQKEHTFAQLNGMIETKNQVLNQYYDLVLCVLEVFDDDKQDTYLPRQKRWFEDLQGYLEQVKGVRLKSLFHSVMDTQLGVLSSQHQLNSNELFNFLPTQNQLVVKRIDLEAAANLLKDTLIAIDAQPQEKAALFNQKIKKWVNLSFVPIAHLIMPFLINGETNNYAAALASANSYFVEAKEGAIARLKTAFMVHACIGVVSMIAGFLMESEMILLLIGASYFIPALMFFLKKNQLSQI